MTSAAACRLAARDLARYRRRGPAETTRRLLALLAEQGLADHSLLDIGGGIGVIAHEALRAGVRHATLVDAATAYVATARTEALRQGHTDRLTILDGNATTLLADLPAVDLVTLERVICCWPDLATLLRPALDHTERAIGLVFPREEWWVRLGLTLLNGALWLRSQLGRWWRPGAVPAPPLWQTLHPLSAVDRLASAAGLVRQRRLTTPLWQIVLYTRT